MKPVILPTENSTEAAEIYPGVDLHYRTSAGKLEFDLLLSAGADHRSVVLLVENASDVRIDADGHLEIRQDDSTLFQRRPVAYQDKNGTRTQLACAYAVGPGNEVRFAIDGVDPDYPLVIDPVVEYSSYLGGARTDRATAVKIGPDGYIYVAGLTDSSDFPVANAYQVRGGLPMDAFVAKIDPATGKKVYATYLGGANSEQATAMTVDAQGSVYVTGLAEARFPTTTGAYQTGNPIFAGFVTKLSPAGNSLVYSTYLLGTRPAAIEVDSAGKAAVTGRAGSAFIPSAATYQTAYAGGSELYPDLEGDAFALLLNAAGSGVIFASFYGGTGWEHGAGVAFDAGGRVVIAGATNSPTLPSVGAIQGGMNGPSDGFIAAFAPDGKSIAYSTYYGGTEGDGLGALAIDAYGNIIVAGGTASTDFPVVNASLSYGQLANRGSLSKLFLAKFGPALQGVKFATFLEPAVTCCDELFSMAIDGAGEIYILAGINSTRLSDLSQTSPFMTQSYFTGKYGVSSNRDATFVMGYSRDGQAVLFNTLIAACGETMTCSKAAISAGKPGQIAVAGYTHVNWHPISAVNSQASFVAGQVSTSDAFIMTLGLDMPAIALRSNLKKAIDSSVVRLTALPSANASTGFVTFWDGSTAIGSAPLIDGVATLDVTVSPGIRRFKATLGAAESAIVFVPTTVSAQ